MQVALGRSAADEVRSGIYQVSKVNILSFMLTIIHNVCLILFQYLVLCFICLIFVLASAWKYWALFYQFAKRRG
jgi:hypothetical protein